MTSAGSRTRAGSGRSRQVRALHAPTLQSAVRDASGHEARRTVPWIMRAALAAFSLRAFSSPSRRRPVRHVCRHVASDHVLGRLCERLVERDLDAALRPRTRDAGPPGARMCTTRGRWAEALRTTPAERRLHRDLRRATESARGRRGRREARVVDLHPDGRLPDRPLAAHLALARASGRRHELTASLVTIGGREDRPLRRRRAPPAPRDRAGPQRAACASSAVDRNADGAGPRRRPTSQRSSTSADVDAVMEVARRHRRRRRAHVSADRAVPVVAAVAEALGLPGDRDADGSPPDAQARDARRARCGRPSATAVREPALDGGCRRRARGGRASRPS